MRKGLLPPTCASDGVGVASPQERMGTHDSTHLQSCSSQRAVLVGATEHYPRPVLKTHTNGQRATNLPHIADGVRNSRHLSSKPTFCAWVTVLKVAAAGATAPTTRLAPSEGTESERGSAAAAVNPYPYSRDSNMKEGTIPHKRGVRYGRVETDRHVLDPPLFVGSPHITVQEGTPI